MPQRSTGKRLVLPRSYQQPRLHSAYLTAALTKPLLASRAHKSWQVGFLAV
jgi:hypothetical protein